MTSTIRVSFFSSLLILFSCNGINDSLPIKNEVESKINCLEVFQSLLSELNTFKGNQDFHQQGFGRGGSYHSWLSKVQAIVDSQCEELLIEKGFVFSELEALGMEYLKTKGVDTDYTTFLNNTFSPHPKVEEPLSEVDKDDNLIGKWSLYNSYANESMKMFIIKEEGFYYAYYPHNESRKKLSKKGDKYDVVGDKYGEYYIVNSSSTLEMFDNEGSLSEVGWSVSIIK